MNIKIFSIYDSKADCFIPPFFMHEQGMAIRAFTDCANSDDHQFSRHPEDYTLFFLGDFDDATGKITTLVTPKSLGLALEFKKTLDSVPTKLNSPGTKNHEVSNDPPVLASPESHNPS